VKLCVHCGLTMGHAWPCPFAVPKLWRLIPKEDSRG